MSDSDLTDFLRDWPHDPGRINARRVTGVDGRDKIQVRIDLGVLQMEVEGRPDGKRPEGFDSQLEFHRHRREEYTQASGADAGFVLSSDDCKALREEAVQFYHRYVAAFGLGDYELVVKDTTHNLATFDLCRAHGETDTDRNVLEQFRPHVIMMRTRAEAEIAAATRDPQRVVTIIDHGLDEIRTCFEDAGRPDLYEHSNEVQLLRGMRDALVPRLPASQRVELEERLRSALDAENYELAAILRDELRLLD